MPPGYGHDFERAHQEAVLAQLVGAYDSFLRELNVLLACGLQDDISLGKLRSALKAQGRTSKALRQLYELREDPASWLRHALDLRHASTRVSGVPLSFYAGGEDDGKVAFKHPRTMTEFPDRATDTLAACLQNMKELFDELRVVAIGDSSRSRPANGPRVKFARSCPYRTYSSRLFTIREWLARLR
jgi:uncharacterized protein DUF6586